MAQQQADYRFIFTSAAGKFDVISFNLTESLSTPFRLGLHLSRMNEDSVDFAAAHDQPGTLTFYKGL